MDIGSLHTTKFQRPRLDADCGGVEGHNCKIINVVLRAHACIGYRHRFFCVLYRGVGLYVVLLRCVGGVDISRSPWGVSASAPFLPTVELSFLFLVYRWRSRCLLFLFFDLSLSLPPLPVCSFLLYIRITCYLGPLSPCVYRRLFCWYVSQVHSTNFFACYFIFQYLLYSMDRTVAFFL